MRFKQPRGKAGKYRTYYLFTKVIKVAVTIWQKMKKKSKT